MLAALWLMSESFHHFLPKMDFDRALAGTFPLILMLSASATPALCSPCTSLCMRRILTIGHFFSSSTMLEPLPSSVLFLAFGNILGAGPYVYIIMHVNIWSSTHLWHGIAKRCDLGACSGLCDLISASRSTFPYLGGVVYFIRYVVTLSCTRWFQHSASITQHFYQ